jgi:hypothetical protein
MAATNISELNTTKASDVDTNTLTCNSISIELQQVFEFYIALNGKTFDDLIRKKVQNDTHFDCSGPPTLRGQSNGPQSNGPPTLGGQEKRQRNW